MFLSILNNTKLSFEHRNQKCNEKYKSIKFESYFSTNTKYEYENGEIVIFFVGTIYNYSKLIEWLNNVRWST
jgi:hypothetical protein